MKSMSGRIGLAMADISIKGTDKGKEYGNPAIKEGISLQVSANSLRVL